MNLKFIPESKGQTKSEFIFTQFKDSIILRKSPELYTVHQEYSGGKLKNQFIRIIIISQESKMWGFRYLDEETNPRYYNIAPKSLYKYPFIKDGKEGTTQWRKTLKTSYHVKNNNKLDIGSHITLTQESSHLYGLSMDTIYLVDGKASHSRWYIRDLETDEMIQIPVLKRHIKEVVR